MNEFDRNNPELFKLGIFYYNPKDPNLIVKKRSGLGWTFNFAHSVSIWVLVLILIIIIISSIVDFGFLNLKW